MGDRRASAVPPVGVSSLLTILGVLCLSVFALLCLSTARAGERMSENAARAVQNYYAADCRAEEILAVLRSGEVPEGVTRREAGVFAYSVGVSDTQRLDVEVAVRGTHYEILRWQTVSVGDWQADQRLEVWAGE